MTHHRRWQRTALWLGLAPLALLSAQAISASSVYDAREKDWRNGAVVYQILVDRFVPSANLAAKKHLYPAPKVLHDWHEVPRRGVDLPDQKLNSQELAFWGGDLQSARSRLDHVQQLGATAVYLNPIHLAYTNHKYDSADYLEVSPEYGSRADLRMLVGDAHARGLKVVLDGVFNHVGRRHHAFQAALASEHSPYRSWFFIGSEYPNGYRGWADVANLPDVAEQHQPNRPCATAALSVFQAIPDKKQSNAPPLGAYPPTVHASSSPRGCQACF